MKQVYIIVEGPSEKEFVENILIPYLCGFGIYEVYAPRITTSRTGKGGFSNYDHLRNDVAKFLHKPNCVITTMVDFFRHPHLPKEDSLNKSLPHYQQVLQLEKWIDEDINDSRFFSYIQLHEYEALLFASEDGFAEYMPSSLDKVRKIMKEFPNPEDINTSPSGAPSKRLYSIDPHYNKVTLGSLIAQKVDIENMLGRCPLFKQWVEKIIQMAM